MSEKIGKANGNRLGENIKRLVKERGMTLSAVAERMGKSRQFLCDVIADRRIMHPSEIVEISLLLKTTPSRLLGFTDADEILVLKGEEMIASITPENAIVKEGYEVTFR